MGFSLSGTVALSVNRIGERIMDNWLNIIPIGLLLLASLVVFDGGSWRRILIGLAVIYFGAFFLYLQVWDFVMGAAKLLTGWMGVAILSFLTVIQGEAGEQRTLPKRIFKVLSLIMVWVVALLLATQASGIFNLSPEIAFTAFALMGCGLLQLGISSQTFKVVIGILTFFAGFEIFYADLESSILVNGLIVAVDLLIAFVGAYLVTITKPEENQ
jgi:hypothetical protein